MWKTKINSVNIHIWHLIQVPVLNLFDFEKPLCLKYNWSATRVAVYHWYILIPVISCSLYMFMNRFSFSGGGRDGASTFVSLTPRKQVFWTKTISFPNHNPDRGGFVPKHNQTISAALSQNKIENRTCRNIKLQLRIISGFGFAAFPACFWH